jgi:hypothetical protein
MVCFLVRVVFTFESGEVAGDAVANPKEMMAGMNVSERRMVNTAIVVIVLNGVRSVELVLTTGGMERHFILDLISIQGNLPSVSLRARR